MSPVERPAVFIGSSTEGLNFARAVRDQLEPDVEGSLWNEDFFVLGNTYIESLVNALPRFDFAVLVLTPDDLVKSRNDETLGPRDNVIFELGLFMGHLGRSRTFAVHQADAQVKIPTDFSGVVTAQYVWPRGDDNHTAAVGPACNKIRRAILSLGFSEKRAQQQIQRLEDQQEKLSQGQSRLETSITDILMALVLDAYEYVTLLKIAGREPDASYIFSQDKGQPLLERLRNRGLVEERGQASIFKDKAHRKISDIKDHFIITEQGQKFLDAIKDRGLGDALKNIVVPG